MVIAERQACRARKAQSERRSDAPATELGHVPVFDAGPVCDGVQPEGRAARKIACDIEIDLAARRFVEPACQSCREGICVKRCLADAVDDAAGRSAPEQDRGRALVDLNGFVIERVAEIIAEVADIIEKLVIAGREAAQDCIITLKARLASPKADAGHGTQGVIEIGCAAGEQVLASDCRHGLRRLEDWRQDTPERCRLEGCSLNDDLILDSIRFLFAFCCDGSVLSGFSESNPDQTGREAGGQHGGTQEPGSDAGSGLDGFHFSGLPTRFEAMDKHAS